MHFCIDECWFENLRKKFFSHFFTPPHQPFFPPLPSRLFCTYSPFFLPPLSLLPCLPTSPLSLPHSLSLHLLSPSIPTALAYSRPVGLSPCRPLALSPTSPLSLSLFRPLSLTPPLLLCTPFLPPSLPPSLPAALSPSLPAPCPLAALSPALENNQPQY